MTNLLKEYVNEEYCITLEEVWKTNGIEYKVQCCPKIKENECGFPIVEMNYMADNLQAAKNTYHRYVRRYIKGRR